MKEDVKNPEEEVLNAPENGTTPKGEDGNENDGISPNSVGGGRPVGSGSNGPEPKPRPDNKKD